MQEEDEYLCKKVKKSEKFNETGFIRSKMKGNYQLLRWKPAYHAEEWMNSASEIPSTRQLYSAVEKIRPRCKILLGGTTPRA